MKIAVVGAGPAGLYFSILYKKARPEAQVSVFERNAPDDSFGFGVVFSDETLSEFLSQDPESYAALRSGFAYWDELDVARDGEVVRIGGNGFCGCSRKTLLELLQNRCLALGVSLHFNREITDSKELSDFDYIIASDGINSRLRTQHQHAFGTEIHWKQNKFVWLGSTRELDAFTYFFRTTPYGTFVAHTYQYEAGKSTWIVECTPQTWQNAGFETENEAQTIATLSEIFADELQGHPLLGNKSHWRQFPVVVNRHWSHENIILLGDAKATAHYSIGSGTKLAMECAIALAGSLIQHGPDRAALMQAYESARAKRVASVQRAAGTSLEWFENIEHRMGYDFSQFAFSVMTRSQKVTYENLALRDASFTSRVLADYNCAHGQFKVSVSAAFSKFNLGGVRLQNRLVMAPMGQYSAEDGLVSDWHLVHYGSRATAGVGLLITEATAVSKSGRITLGCPGLWSENQALAWKRITHFIHKNSKSKIALQLGHSGARGAQPIPGERTLNSTAKTWETIAASQVSYSVNGPIPKAMDDSDRARVIAEFTAAAVYAEEAGFDMIELQAHHGFLLASYLSPLTNLRTDNYGGSLENRLRFPLEVFGAVRDVFPLGKPVGVRLSVVDAPGGLTPEDINSIAVAFKEAGAAFIDLSGGSYIEQQPQESSWRAWDAELVRNAVEIPVFSSGNVTGIDEVNTLLLSGVCNLVALGKPLLIDPGFVRRAQAYENHVAEDVPNQYKRAVAPFTETAQRQRAQTDRMKKLFKPESHKPLNP